VERGYDVAQDARTDAQLVAQLRSGSGDALGELFDRHADRIYTYCFRRTASWAVAQDATSTVFLEAWRSRERAAAYDGAALPWLYGIATNVCRNLTRSQRRHAAALGRLPRPPYGPDHADEVGDRVDTERTMARIAAAMADLPERDREVIALVVWSGLSYEEAAVALGCPVGTVRSRLSRARARLATAIEEDR
jgi:RNA polymerase sigma factor (sigma-70 family)